MKVLKRIADFGLKLSPSKCKFFQTKVKYLGHVISAQGIQPDPDKVAAIREWPRPQTVRELRSFLGFTGYYQRFVRDYSRIVQAFNDLLKGEFAPRHKGQSHWKRPIPLLSQAFRAVAVRKHLSLSLRNWHQLRCLVSQTGDCLMWYIPTSVPQG